MPKSTAGLVTEGIAEAIRNYTAIKNQERTLKNEMIINRINAENNWLYKMKEMQQQNQNAVDLKKTLNPLEEQQLNYQKQMQEEWTSQNQGGMDIQPGQEVFGIPPRPQVVPDDKGFKRSIPDDKSWAMQLIRAKEKKFQETGDQRYALTQGEENFKKRYYGAKQENDVKALSDLRKEFINRPEVKEFITIDTQVKSMDSLLNKALSGGKQNQLALDQALITMFNKLTDPNSVVRESEYARTPENLPIVNRIAGAIEKVKRGGAGITNEDRKALVLGAKIIANERGKVFNTTYDDYAEIASSQGLEPSIATRKMERFQEYDVAIPKASSNDTGFIEGKVYRDAKGNKAQFVNGKFVEIK